MAVRYVVTRNTDRLVAEHARNCDLASCTFGRLAEVAPEWKGPRPRVRRGGDRRKRV